MAARAGPPPARAPAARLLRRGWVGIAQVVAIAAIAAGAGAAIWAERAMMHQGFGVLARTRVSTVTGNDGVGTRSRH